MDQGQQRGSLIWFSFILALFALPAVTRLVPPDDIEMPTKLNVVQPDSIPLQSVDPNLATSAEWIQLGVPVKLARQWAAYTKAGAKIRNKKDLLRLNGMDSILLSKVWPYLCCLSKPKSPPVYLDANTADSTDFLAIRGIGPAIAGRIIRFRSKLGGFVSMNQFNEVYGLDTSVVQQLRNKFRISPGFIPQRLAINKLSENELCRHPYIDRKSARTLVAYRFQHGALSIADFPLIRLPDTLLIQKITPYLDFSE